MKCTWLKQSDRLYNSRRFGSVMVCSFQLTTVPPGVDVPTSTPGTIMTVQLEKTWSSVSYFEEFPGENFLSLRKTWQYCLDSWNDVLQTEKTGVEMFGQNQTQHINTTNYCQLSLSWPWSALCTKVFWSQVWDQLSDS